jgi:hypothetical protein
MGGTHLLRHPDGVGVVLRRDVGPAQDGREIAEGVIDGSEGDVGVEESG